MLGVCRRQPSSASCLQSLAHAAKCKPAPEEHFQLPHRQADRCLFADDNARCAVSREKVANVLLAKGSGLNIAHAAQGIARSVARELLSPLLDAACARLGFVLRRAYDVACERQQLLEGVQDRGDTY